MNTGGPIRLVKDFADYRIFFYWIDSRDNQISPALETLYHAREWFYQHHCNQYAGPERRLRQADRRNQAAARGAHSSRRASRRANSIGRRLTDQPVHVSADLARGKIQTLIAALENGNPDPLVNVA